MQSFVVEFWSRIFLALRYISVFEVVRRLFPKANSAGFVDLWVIGHVIGSLLAVVLSVFVKNPLVSYIVVGYGILRIFEITIYQINVLLFDEHRARKSGKKYALHGYRRIVLLLLHNYAEIIFWFAATYLYLSNQFTFHVSSSDNSVAGGIYSSFIVMTTFGESNISPKSLIAALILLAQSTVGLFMTLLSLARFIALLPTPKSLDEFER